MVHTTCLAPHYFTSARKMLRSCVLLEKRSNQRETKQPKRNEATKEKRSNQRETKQPKRNEATKEKRSNQRETKQPKRNEATKEKRSNQRETKQPKRNETTKEKRSNQRETKQLELKSKNLFCKVLICHALAYQSKVSRILHWNGYVICVTKQRSSILFKDIFCLAVTNSNIFA